MGKLFEILKNRSEQSDMEHTLCSLACKIVEKTKEHQKRVLSIMSEYDLHDEIHLDKVEQNIVELIEEDNVYKLSSFEMFLLLMSARLHDCGMAPANYELQLMSLTEGNARFCENKLSCCHDGKTPMKIKEAKDFIKAHKENIYGNFGQIKDWLFSPDDENILITDLAEVLVDYQEFRNGYTEKINNQKHLEDYKEYNKKLRVEYIRIHHAEKASKYICNMSHLFETFLGEIWPKQLLNDLGQICQAHGESIDYLKGLDTDRKYADDGNEVNLQFIAEMLRLGDIIHYSRDRAPSILRNAIAFKSDYSKAEWAVKGGLQYSINNGIISFTSFCQNPEAYYHLQDYLNWIDDEIHNLDSLKKNWHERYRIAISEVDRSNVKYDASKFTPAVCSGFTLSQSKILELLMGVKLYKNPFACLRELYQNALDACRCMNGINKKKHLNSEGIIEFGLGDDEKGRYLYCKDNGLGMTQSVIENYLLKIGNSYYKSQEYSRHVADWGAAYTPVSQFGIGILSCFIIGEKLEILTRSHETKDMVKCCIDGVHEHVYYATLSEEDKEEIADNGTMVKVYLSPEYNKKINNAPIDKLGLVFLYGREDTSFSDEYASYSTLFSKWETSLYNYLNNYINSVPENIKVSVRFSDNSIEEIYDKPFEISIGKLGISEDDKPFIDYIMNSNFMKRYYGSIYDIQKYLKQYKVSVRTDNITYSTIITLPLSGMVDLKDDLPFFRNLCVNGSSISVDGIVTEAHISDPYSFHNGLTQNGCINYEGSIRPQLSVDRKEIVSYPIDYKDEYKILTEKAISEAVIVTQKHIETYRLNQDINTVNLVWKYIFNKFHYGQVLFVNKLAQTPIGSFKWPTIDNMLEQSTEIKDLLTADHIVLKPYNHKNLDPFGQKLVKSLFFNAKSVDVVDENTIVIYKGNSIDVPDPDDAFGSECYIVPCNDSKVFKEYDIVSNLYPIVPQRLINSIYRYKDEKLYGIVQTVHKFSNNFTQLFFQDARLIHSQMGLYNSKGLPGEESDHYVYEFNQSISGFQCMDFIPNQYQRKEAVPILAYIAPSPLTPKDKELLEKRKTSDHEYYDGVMNGWTVLVTCVKTLNVVIKPGKVSRKEMVSLLSDDFWEEYKDWKFKFLDGVIMSKK